MKKKRRLKRWVRKTLKGICAGIIIIIVGFTIALLLGWSTEKFNENYKEKNYNYYEELNKDLR